MPVTADLSAAPSALPDIVMSAYGLAGSSISVLNGGRTNLTLHAATDPDLVVQQLPAGSHDDLLGVMENLVRVTSHLDWARRTGPQVHDPWYPQLVPTTAGKPFLMTEQGDVWRAFAFRPGRVARGSLSPGVVCSIAEMYARFTTATDDLGGPDLLCTTERFHDLNDVHETFTLAMSDGGGAYDSERTEALTPYIDLVDRLVQRCHHTVAADGLLDIEHRVVHNDTKLSNALLDEAATAAVSVLDLDLVMMGPVWHDVGDLVRSALWHADPAGGAAPIMQLDVIQELLGAYTRAARPVLADAEIATFAVAGPRLSTELGIRYLTDHIRRTPRLRVSQPGGHIERGLANLRLADEMFDAYDALRTYVDTLVDTRS